MSSQRPSAEFHDHSTMVSRNGSPRSKAAAGDPPRVESLDLEATTIRADDDIEKAKINSTHESTSQHIAEAPLERRESAIHEAWPAPELKSDATLQREAELEEKDVFLVTFEDNDSLNPKVFISSWSHHRWRLIMISVELVKGFSLVPVRVFYIEGVYITH